MNCGLRRQWGVFGEPPDDRSASLHWPFTTRSPLAPRFEGVEVVSDDLGVEAPPPADEVAAFDVEVDEDGAGVV